MAGFTALNGGEAKPADTSSSAASPSLKRATSEERNSVAAAGPEPAASEGRSTQEEHWSGRPRERGERNYHATAYSGGDIIHKRKRSSSPKPSREPPNVHDPLPRPESREAYRTSQRESDYRPYGTESQDRDAWYARQHREDRAVYDTQNSVASGPSPTDEQMGGDPLRRSTGLPDSQSQREYSATSPDGDDSSMIYSGSYTPDQRRDPVIQSDPKKRKRNFSNRTKTGCLTCRKRKKKCDEAKPECSNCVRGGFTCHGYPNQRGYQKMENKSSAVPLESKDPTYRPPGAYGMPQPQSNSYQSPAPPPAPKRDSVPPYRGQPLRIDPPQGRPVMTDDDRQTASTLPSASVGSPDNKLSALSTYTSAANVFPTPISAVQLQTPLSGVDRSKEYQRVPPLHDLTRTEPETPHPNSLPQINILHPTRTSSPLSQPHPPPPVPTSNPQVAAQLALSHTSFPSSRQQTQKEMMLQGRQYYPFDSELVKERSRCSAACWRFNNSTNPNTGVSTNERSRLFQQILNPTEPINISPHNISPVTSKGRVGSEVVVEAPFTCDYGYNLTIGNNVFIGRNCTIIDPCEIKIGTNSYLGPNVSLYGATLHTDSKRRQGSKSPQVGSSIIIEDDVWIGGGAIILPGRKVGRGATVAAGSIVTKDVPPYVVVAGNPAQVMRGA